MHIAIEGMDGVGKTTVAKKLADKLNYIIVEKPLHYLFDNETEISNYLKYRDFINEQTDNDALRAWFYGLGNIFLYHQFKNENIITDRHLLSNYYWCGGEKTECIFQCLIELIGKPDFTILLYASPEEGARRITARDPQDPDVRKTKLYINARNKMEDFLLKNDMEHLMIDTTNITADEVVVIILDSLPARMKSSLRPGE